MVKNRKANIQNYNLAKQQERQRHAHDEEDDQQVTDEQQNVIDNEQYKFQHVILPDNPDSSADGYYL